MDENEEGSFNKRAKSDNRSTEELLDLAWENFGKKPSWACFRANACKTITIIF